MVCFVGWDKFGEAKELRQLLFSNPFSCTGKTLVHIFSPRSEELAFEPIRTHGSALQVVLEAHACNSVSAPAETKSMEAKISTAGSAAVFAAAAFGFALDCAFAPGSPLPLPFGFGFGKAFAADLLSALQQLAFQVANHGKTGKDCGCSLRSR